MKIYSIYIVCLLAIFSISACNNNNHPDVDTSLINTSTPQVLPAKDSLSSFINPGNTTPVTVNNSSTVALNPPHGQPGHDCAIPVGQPLNGKSNAPVTPPTAPAMPTFTTTPQKVPISNSNSSVALNPPHGQPGHDCAIPVGQPLKG